MQLNAIETLIFFNHRLSPEGVDIVLDCMCGEDANKGISLLKPMGKYILYGKSGNSIISTLSFLNGFVGHLI